jgi:hypothetical protein
VPEAAGAYGTWRKALSREPDEKLAYYATAWTWNREKRRVFARDFSSAEARGLAAAASDLLAARKSSKAVIA